MSDLIVRPRHVRQASLCMPGARGFFAENGWSWPDFVVNGIDADKLTATGDPRALRAVAAAEQEAKNGRR